jgi:NDP-4-keto-2,6-dideoxyhexose 3-C-methyltransferase
MASDLFHKIEKCRVCGNEHLVTVLDLGEQYLSGIFPKKIDTEMPRGPLKLVKCNEEEGGCGHVQLEHTYDLPTMYGQEYGYRSGLNNSMVKHLQSKAEKIQKDKPLKSGDIVVDIAGNDGTFLGFFPEDCQLLSIDPTSEKFSKFFKPNVNYIADFFSAELFKKRFGNQKAKVITSFSMFYDLDDPCEFARQVRECLAPEGIWVLEQSYMPEMLRVNSFDTVCHEHLSYYGMRQLKYIMDKAGFNIVDYEFNDVNGGSISLVVSPNKKECTTKLTALLGLEIEEELDTVKPWEEFSARMTENNHKFLKIVRDLRDEGYKVAGLGASTKGNVTLQTWGITPTDILAIGEVNPDKHGSFAPGTWIPIKDEDFVLGYYDVFVILPWHFRNFFVNNPKFKGKTLLFPLPTPEIVVP